MTSPTTSINSSTSAPVPSTAAKEPPSLPASAEEVVNAESLSTVITKLTSTIISAVKDGKSVTALNKRLIIMAADEIRRASSTFANIASICALPAHTPTSDCSALDEMKKEISALVREEVASIKQLVARPPACPAPPLHFAVPAAPPVVKPSIIISSKRESTSSADTLSAWKKNISFRDTNFTPANVQFVSNNKLRVEFDSPEHMEVTLKKIGEFNPDITAEISKKLKPMLVVKGVSSDITPESLKDIILNQNECVKDNIKNSNDLIFKFKRTNKNPQLYNAVFMSAPYLWRIIVNQNKLNVDHQRVHVEEFCPLLQCFKCLKFGHTRKFCKSDETHCSYCSGNHEFKDCPVKKDNSQAICYNCKAYHEKSNKNNEKLDHSATSDHCPRKQFMVVRTRNRVDYGS